MKKIFLLDDEVQVREGIQRCIEWDKEGFIYCGDAPDGEIALPLIEKHQPDIVITDIKMPFMDGLEVSRILRKKMPSVKIIILSGHDEFEYAREAMRIQITEYCLKPISAPELLETLHKVARQIDKEALEKQRLNELENQVIQNETMTKDYFLNQLCEGDYTASEAIKQASELEINLVSQYYCLVTIETAPSSMTTIQSLANDYPCLSFKRNAKECVFILKGDEKSTLEQSITDLKKQLLQIAKSDKSIIFGFGQIESRIQGIATSFTKAEEEKSYYRILHRYRQTNEKGEILSDGGIHVFNRTELIQFLRFGDSVKIDEFAKSYSAYLQENNVSTPFFVYYFLMDFTMTIKHYIKEMAANNTTILDKIQQLEMTASWIRDYDEVVVYMKKLLKLIVHQKNPTTNTVNPIIMNAKEFIQKHYVDSQLSLQKVAQAVNVSPSYFSHIFSQETGQTLIEYITMVRIEKAKDLLKTTNAKTYEIAHEVGYSDAHYFCNIFKKVTGMTTRAYKASEQTLSF
ncbi:response regulator [Metabacillus malikii]|uniref:Two-component system response regulator YesN n=1 Tax=Metabacillus malikii TaxID=1504265 RepID=A0ABT9ZFX9_9BACI|nr:response regulator [Metabacillus malikii]MDQ0231192.1 two-component system response regulator YesN [Metabacillus malikii]